MRIRIENVHVLTMDSMFHEYDKSNVTIEDDSIIAINDDSLDDTQLDKEIRRSEAVQKIAKTIIDNGNLALQAKKHLDEYGQGENIELPMLGVTNK